MIYPRLPYQNKKVKKLLTKFLGLNFTENTTEGEFYDTNGLSTKNYPTLTQRGGRLELDGYNNVADVFEWGGKLVVVADATLYYDGVAVTSVTQGKKQFAVVNTHLIVFPDKIDIDLTSEQGEGGTRTFTFKNLIPELITATSPNSCQFNVNGHDIKGTIQGKIRHQQISGYRSIKDGEYFYSSSVPYFYTYGTDKAAVAACWQNGAWNMTALEALKVTKDFSGQWTDGMLNNGDILIPKFNSEDNSYHIIGGTLGLSGTWPNFTRPITTPVDTTKYNTQGVYLVMNDDPEEDNSRWEVWHSYEEHDGQGYVQITTYFESPGVDLYAAATRKWSDEFHIGDIISCTGTTSGTYDFSEAKITAINDNTNTMTVYGKNSSTGEWDQNPFPTTAQNYSIPITFRATFPDLDFICERGNRLWGVSNKDKTIYASSLGIPSQMKTYGTDADSYAVAIGSEGDFTAICNYGGAVCCFKERKVHKILGDVPSNFYMVEYNIDGVQKGSEKSLAIINETLFYKGVNGVYTFSGSTPSLISAKLGRDTYYDGVGGTDGERYYLHVKDSKFNHYLLTFDLQNGLWIKEDNLTADAFTMASDFYMASGGTLYKMNQDNNEEFDWYAEFTPFYTMSPTSSSYTRAMGKQGYSKLTIGFEMEKGSRFSIDIKEDDKQWKRAYTRTADKKLSTCIPINMGRCDVFRIKISGHGRVKIYAMERQYTVGSEV